MNITVSKTAKLSPMLTPDTNPAPPTSPALIFVIMEPYKLGINITSNCWGLETNWNCIIALYCGFMLFLLLALFTLLYFKTGYNYLWTCILQLSTIISWNSISGKSLDTSRAHSKNNPSAIFLCFDYIINYSKK